MLVFITGGEGFGLYKNDELYDDMGHNYMHIQYAMIALDSANIEYQDFDSLEEYEDYWNKCEEDEDEEEKE